MGHGIYAGRPGSSSSIAAVRVRARRRPLVRGALDLRTTATPGRSGIRSVPDRLRQLSISGRVRSRARFVSRHAGAWIVYGTMAFDPHDRHWDHLDAVGLLACAQATADPVWAVRLSESAARLVDATVLAVERIAEGTRHAGRLRRKGRAQIERQQQ